VLDVVPSWLSGESESGVDDVSEAAFVAPDAGTAPVSASGFTSDGGGSVWSVGFFGSGGTFGI